MDTLPPLVPLSIGLVTLLVGAEILVRNSSRLAAILGISPLMVGLTVVALGTSSPELAISLKSTLGGNSGLALGNVVGSNILNILLILGLASLIRPVRVSEQLIRLDVPVMVFVSFMVLILALDGGLSRTDGLLLVFLSVVYMVLLVWAARKAFREEKNLTALDPNPGSDPDEDEPRGPQGRTGHFVARFLDPGSRAYRRTMPVVRLLLVGVGIVLLVQGAGTMVDAAVRIAQARGWSPLVVGLTVLAAGTSLPELAASSAASLRGQGDIAAGNVVGSNLLNLLVVLGLTALLTPGGITVPGPALFFDLPVMVAVAFACLPIFFTGHVVSRVEGGLFFFYYLAYTAYLILQGTREEEALETLLQVSITWFAIPLTALMLIFTVIQERGRARRQVRRFQGD